MENRMKGKEAVSGNKPLKFLSIHRQAVVALTAALLYAILVFYTARFHEPWFDEAQSWLMVRDLNLWNLLAHHLRYEGHPSLWYLVLWLPVHMGLPYQWLPLIPAAIAVLTAWLVFRYAPFPPFITWMIPFGYYFVYQYAVIARSYVLIPLILSALAILYKKRLQRPVLFFVLITLLAHVSLHGTVIAAGLGLAEFVNAIWWPEGAPARHRRFSHWFFLVLAINALLLAVQLSFPDGLIYMGGNPEKSPFQIVNHSMTGIWGFSLVFWLLIVLWLFHRKAVLLYLFPFVGLLRLFSGVYKVWHGGLLFVLLIFVLWISYPTGEEKISVTDKVGRRYRTAFLVVFGCTLSIHIIWGIRAIRYDLKNSYSGSQSCANALKSAGLDSAGLYMIGYNTMGVQPYFDRNIFINNPTPGNGAFWFWSTANPLVRNMVTPARFRTTLDKLKAEKPRYALVGVYDSESQAFLNRILAETPYRVNRSFRGSTGWKGDPYERDDLFLLRRVE
ncbi:MAG: hypothetical protein GXO70_08565 [Acidobacteria bacterium]|nr:hypothetical protein [Acidobacteriota bacterium]